MVLKHAAAFLVIAFAAGCAAKRPAPVVERSPEPPARAEVSRPAPPRPAEKPVPTYVVKRGDTLVGIALQYGLDYLELAAWNGIANPNVISVGQTLLLAAPAGAPPVPVAAPVATPLASNGPVIESRDRKSTRLNSSHEVPSRMPSSA